MPGIGLEIPLLSCLMLTVEYQFRMGLGANHTVEDRSFAPVRTDYIRAKGFRHGLNFGLKIDLDRKSTRLNSSHANISYAVFCLKKNKLHSTHNSHFFCTSAAL